MRVFALHKLAEGWKNEPKMFQFFYKIAVNDSFKHSSNFYAGLESNPRATALEIILQYYPNYPQTLPLLQDRAKNDPDEQLQKWAKKIIDSTTANN